MGPSRANMKKPLVVEEQSESEESISEGQEEGGMNLSGNNLDTSEIKEEPESEAEEDVNGKGTGNQSENTENYSEDENVNASDSEATNEDDQIESEVSDSDQKKSSNKPKLSLKKSSTANPSKNIEADSDSEEDEVNDNFDDSDMDGDDESEDDADDEEHGHEKSSKSGLANVMAKILGTRKSENVILSKAKKDWTVKKKKDVEADEESFEVVDSSGQVKVEQKVKVEEEDVKDLSNHEREIMRKVWEKRFRVKPDVTVDYEKERKLKVLATQGVVQLFSAIEKHKNMIQKKLSQTRSVMGREKIMETTGKEAFMEMLREQGKKFKKEDEEGGEKEDNKDEVKLEVKDEPIDLPPAPKKPKWNVLSDNFYKEPTLQGWDQQSDDDDES